MDTSKASQSKPLWNLKAWQIIIIFNVLLCCIYGFGSFTFDFFAGAATAGPGVWGEVGGVGMYFTYVMAYFIALVVVLPILVIKRFFGFLLVEGYIQEDPSQRLPRPKVGKRLPKALTILQVQALFVAMDSESRAGRRDRVFFQLTYAGGLRVGEAVGLKVDDTDFTQGTLRVVGKGNRKRRIYLKPFVLKQLQGYITESGLDNYLFPGRGHGHIAARNMQMRLKKYVRKAGLPEYVSPHSLRHSIAVHYLIGGAPITFVQNLLGHESLATTGIYTQLADEMTKEIALNTETALDRLEEWRLKEAAVRYEPDFEEWDAFVSEVLEWL